MNPNVKPSQVYPIKTEIAPQSVAAAGSASSGWVLARDSWLSLVLLLGALGGATLSVDVLEATDGSGTGSQTLLTGVLAGLATNNSTASYDFKSDANLTLSTNYEYIAFRVNVVGGTGSLVAAAVIGGPQRFAT